MGHLLEMAKNDLGLTQFELGVKLGVSRRTMIRWGRHQTQPAPFQIEQLAGLLRQAGEGDTADSLLECAGLPVPEEPAEVVAPPPAPPGPPPEPPPPPPPPPAPTQRQVEAVLYAAADAADITPRKARLALRAALLRARDLGVLADAVAEALGTG